MHYSLNYNVYDKIRAKVAESETGRDANHSAGVTDVKIE